MGWATFWRKLMSEETNRRKKGAPGGATPLKSTLLSLEQRLMFDAAAAATTAEVASEQVAQEQANAAVSSDADTTATVAPLTESEDLFQALTTFLPADSPTEIVFVDPTVPDYQALLAGMDPAIEVVVLDGGQDGIEQMAGALSGRTGIDAIHLISHGEAGELHLGTGVLTAESMSSTYAGTLATIRQAMSENGDILVYGCDFAKGDTGQRAVERLADLTGADVQASNDSTGHSSLGGDWDLEVRAGSIETQVAVADQTQLDWIGVLAETWMNAGTGAVISGPAGNDWYVGDSANNTPSAAGGGADIMYGAGGDDTLQGGSGNDILVGGTGNDTIYGNSDDDVILGGAGNDYLDGGSSVGKNTIIGGGGNDQMVGGSGADVFRFTGAQSGDAYTVDGAGGTDIIDLSEFSTATITNSGGVITVDRGSGNVFTITHSNVESIITAATVGNHGPLADAGVDQTVAMSATVTLTAAGSSDRDGNSLTYQWTQIEGTKVTLSSSTAASPTFTAPGSATTLQFVVVVSDGTTSHADTVTINVGASNSAPTISNLGGDSLSYTEGAGAVVIDQGANALVADVDSANFDMGTLSVSIPVGGVPTEDVLSIRNQGTGAGQIGISGNTVTYGGVTIGTFTGGAGGNNLVISFNSNATTTAVTALVKNVTYEDISIDSPEPGSFTIRFALSDGDGGTSANYDVSANVVAVNDAPTDLSLSANTVAENVANGTVVGTITATDPDVGDTKAYSLTSTAGGRFAINSSTGVITVANGSLLNYESAISHNVTVRVTDSGGLTYDETFTINVTDVNEATPVISSNGGGATASVTVSENATAVTTVTATDADTRQTLAYSITGGADAAKFAINSSTGALSFVSAPNYESPADSGGNNIYDVTVQVSDGMGGTDTQAIAVTVTNVNETPTDLSLSASTVAENATNGTVIGAVTATDADTGDTKAYALADSAGGRFAINSSTGQITVANGSLLNYESATSHNVTVRVTDSGGLTYDETFTINVTNVNEAPTGADVTITISEDTSHTLTTANFGFSDVDAGDSLSAVRIDTVPGAGSLTLSGSTVTAGQVIALSDITAGNLVFTPAANANGTSYASCTFSVRDSNNAYDSGPNLLTVNVTAVNDAPLLVPQGLTTNTSEGAVPIASTVSTLIGTSVTDVDSGALSGVAIFGMTGSGGTLEYSLDGTTWVSAGALSSSSALLLRSTDQMRFTPDSNNGGTIQVSFRAWDQTTGSAGSKVDVSVTGGSTAFSSASDVASCTIASVNDAPVLADTALTLTVAEDAGAPSGAVGSPVSAFTGGVTDVDSGALKGIAITGSNETNGTWYYTTNNGSTWTAVGTVSNTSALVLADNANTRLYFAPKANYNGTSTAALTVRAWDQTSGTAGTKVTTASNGGTTAFSSATDTIGVTVSAVNDAPVLAVNNGATVLEGGSAIVSPKQLSATDVDNGASELRYTMTGLPTNGALLLKGVRLSLNDTFTQADIDSGILEYLHDGSETSADSFDFIVEDDARGSIAGSTFKIVVTAVNDAPTDLSLSANTVAENVANGTVVGTVTGTDVDTGDTKRYAFTDSAGGRFAINSSTGQITVANSSLLNYESATSHNVTVRVTDSGGLTYDETFTIHVTNVNEAPTGADTTVTISEDTSHVLTAANFGFSDVDAGDTLNAVRIDSLPTAGTLKLSGVDVTPGQIITTADINAGHLVFSPAADGNGLSYAALTFSVRDSGNLYDAVPNTLTFRVTAVNDAPVNSLPGVQTVAVDTPLAITGLAINDVDSNLTTVHLSVNHGTVAVSLSGATTISSGASGTATLTISGTQADINATLSSLTYQGDSLYMGADTLTVLSTDSNGATDTDAVSITVSNAAPTNILPAAQTVAEDTPLAISSLSVADADGNLETVQLSSQHGTLTVSLSGATVISVGSNGSSSVTLSGSQAELNATLASLIYQGNPNFAGLDTITITSTDHAGTADTDILSITVTAVHDAPTNLALSSSSVVEHATNGTTVGTVTPSDPDAGETFTFQLTDSAGGRFAIDSTTGQITVVDGTLLDMEFAASHNVTVRVTDSGGLTYDKSFSIDLIDVNEAPRDLSLSSNTVAENPANGTVVGTVTGIEVDVGDSLTYSLTDAAGGRFAIDPTTGQLTVADGTLLNYETAASHDVTVRVTDSGGLTYDETFTIALTNVNETPTNLALSSHTVVEHATNGTTVGTVTPSDPDAGETFTFQLADSAGGRFAIDSTTGQIIDPGGCLFHKKAIPSHDVTVRVTDNGGLTYDKTFTIDLTDINETPIDLVLSSDTVVEHAANGTVVGTVTGSDPDNGDTAAYSLTDDAGGRFAINSSTGQITVANGALLNYEGAASHDVTVRVTDSGGLMYDETFTITLTDVNDAPTALILSANTVAENAANGTTVGIISTADPDAVDSHTYSLTDTAGGRFTINSSTGEITVADGSLLNYESATSHSVTVRTTDAGGLTRDQTFTITLTDVNEAPTGADATVTILEDTPYTLTLADFGFSDVDAGDALSAVRLDSLPAAGTLTLSGGAVTAGQVITAADLAAGRLVFTPAADANGPGNASVTFSVQDSHSAYAATPSTLVFDVTAVNDAPILMANTGSTVTEGGTDTISSGELSVTDADESAAQLTFSIGTGPAHGRLELTTAPGVSVSTFTQADIAANRVIYVHDGSETTSDSISFTVSDGAGGSIGSTTVTLTVTPVNDAPTITSDGGGATAAVNVAEHISAVTIVGGADVDLPAQALSYSISGGVDQALFVIDAATGALSFTAPRDFEAPADLNGDNVYVVQVRVTDSQGASVTQTIHVTVTDVAESPAPAQLSPSLVPSTFSSVVAPVSAIVPARPLQIGSVSEPIAKPVIDAQGSGKHVVAPASHEPTLRSVSRPDESRPLIESERGRESQGAARHEPAALPPLPLSIAESHLHPEEGERDLAQLSDLLFSKLDEVIRGLEESVAAEAAQQTYVTRIAAASGVTLSVGFVVWALRSTALLTSLFATIPAWQMLDPLPVVASHRVERVLRTRAQEMVAQEELVEHRGLHDLLDEKQVKGPRPTEIS